MGETPGNQCMGEAKTRQSKPDRRKPADSANDFFAVGTPLHAVRASYIRRPADEAFFETLLTGRYAHVIAPDQSGKTSLIAATAERLKANGAQVAVLDLAQLVLRDSGNDAGRFYYSVAYRILRQLRIKFELQPWWQDKAMLSNRQRLHEFYAEVILGETRNPVVILIDEVQCVEALPFTDQLLTSVRSAHDARTTDPEFTRLTFALCGECDPASLVDTPEASPFQVTRSIPLRDFTREEIGQFATELNIPSEAATVALDRIFFWTDGQPYLTQKLARAVSREAPDADIDAFVDQIVAQQFANRASLANEPLLNHVQMRILNDPHRDQLLNLYGRIRKGVDVVTDLGSALQRRLIAVGLLIVDERGDLGIRNRIYSEVFTARWANENLHVNWRAPVVVMLVLLAFLLVPFWYTQWLPRAYLSTLTDASTPLDVAETTWTNLRSFPGHTQTADDIYRLYIDEQARLADTRSAIDAVAARAAALEDAPGLPDRLVADYYDRVVSGSIRDEARDPALLASLEALGVPTPERRRRAAMLLGEDYPTLLASLTEPPGERRSIDSTALAITDIDGAAVRQWTMSAQGLRRTEPWSITALDVTPIVRRVIVDQEGSVRRVSLTLTLSHARHTDLRIKVIAPSGKIVEIETGRERSSVVDEIRIPTADLAAFLGEPLTGTRSLSIRDEETGVAGHLVGWNLTLNGQGLVEDFQRGIDIPDPVEVEASNIWVSGDGRYAVARATHSDNARVWDLAFAKPVRALALNQNETLIGLDAGARRLVTATLDSVNLWDTATGDRIATLPVGGGGLAGRLTDDSKHLFLTYPGDTETRFELWSLDTQAQVAALTVAGTPALSAIDADGRRLAVADFDRSVRVWDFREGELLTQLNLAAQPSDIRLAAGGGALGVVYGRFGVSLWSLADGGRRLFELLDPGAWRLAFSPSGTRVLAGRPGTGFRVYDTRTGVPAGSAVGMGAEPAAPLAFSLDESILVTGGPAAAVRFWRMPLPGGVATETLPDHAFWRPGPDTVAMATPDARKLLVSDAEGHLHVIPRNTPPAQLAAVAANEVNYLGHSTAVVAMATDDASLWAATAAEDGSLRAWGLADGLPEPWVVETASGVVDLAFSPDSRLIAVLDSAGVLVVERDTGAVVARYAHATPLSSLVFGANDTLYAGAADGLLMTIRLRRGSPPEARRIWQGTAAITHVARGPRADQLIVVDAANTARTLSVDDGSILTQTLTLPSRVVEVAVAPIGARVLFRTERWVHSALASIDGLIWADATLIEPAQRGHRLAFDRKSDARGRPGAPLILSADNAGIGLAPLVDAADGPGLFGSREELLADWAARLGLERDSSD